MISKLKIQVCCYKCQKILIDKIGDCVFFSDFTAICPECTARLIEGDMIARVRIAAADWIKLFTGAGMSRN